jgi:F0F1-type ATP synthase membrane subunit b/b'
MKYSKIVDIVVLVILVWIVARFIYRQVSKKMKMKKNKNK